MSRLQRGWWNKCNNKARVENSRVRKSTNRNWENTSLMIFLFPMRFRWLCIPYKAFIFCNFLFSEILLYFYNKLFVYLNVRECTAFSWKWSITNTNTTSVCFHCYVQACEIDSPEASPFPFLSAAGKSNQNQSWNFSLKIPKFIFSCWLLKLRNDTYHFNHLQRE